jgi:Fe-S-cluster-containing dehydrogenase component/anaerobic selenocysteine-containing dehydrogenase
MSQTEQNARRMWSDPSDLTSAPTRDEFTPEVESAIADLRARGGIESPNCPEDRDRQRDDLHFAHAGVNRRGFLQLTGAAAVFAVVSGCSKPHPDTLVPYAQQPDGVTIGNGVWYSTVVRVNGQARPIMAKTYDGRPIKLDGNPDHPLVRGRSDAATQAALLDLYDPDRGGIDPEQPKVFHDGPKRRDGDEFVPVTWADLDTAVAAGLKSGRVLLVTGPVDGPARLAHIAALRAAFGDRLRHVAYHPWAADSALKARHLVLGESSVPEYRLGKAKVLVALGSDLLAGADIATQAAYGEFRRGTDGEPGQVICFEPTMSQLGSCADVRVRVGMDSLAWLCWAIAAEVAAATNATLPPAIADVLAARIAPIASALRPVRTATGDVHAITYAAQRLLAARQANGQALVYVGGAVHSGPESLDLHIAATWLNRLLGAEGVCVLGRPPSATRDGLSAELAAGADVVIVAGGANPAYDLPGAAAALGRIPLLVSLNPTRDETTRLAHLHAPGLHDLESWGDSSSSSGLVEVQQPVIQPLWDSRAAEDSLSAFTVAALGEAAPAELRIARAAVPANAPVSVVSRKQLWNAAERGIQPWHAFVQQVWTSQVQGAVRSAASGTAFWNAALSTGFVAVPRQEMPANRMMPVIEAPAGVAPGGLTLVCSAARSIGDGSQLNNAWLQELPDPVSKVCWDGWAAVSPADAKAQGIATHDVVELAIGQEKISLPALVQDGQHPGHVEVFLGWGRSNAGTVAAMTADAPRANAYLVAGGRRWGAAVSLTRTGQHYELAMTQTHHRMAGEQIAMDDVLELHRKDPGAARRSHKSHAWEAGTDGKPGGRLSIWRSHQTYPGLRWGMAIDLDACTGCGACMVACSAENNVPVVGRDEVRKTREMHWIRVDRYYSAPASESDARLDVSVLHQPMLCQQCDNAPCEAVCPANATMKSDEGVNLQIYNRCIGTRYCSNNCPYKVRRFNWYQYSAYRAGPQKAFEPLGRLVKNVITEGNHTAGVELAHQPLQLMLNPEVTVRHRGVMEKCNFCTQRQRAWRTDAKRQGKRMPDGHLTSACAQACPTRALTWGDLNDQESEVAVQSNDPRAYLALDAESNTRPKVAYLRKLRNRPATEDELKTLDGHAAETHE